MGCLRTGAIAVLSTFVGWVVGWTFASSINPVPDWLLRRFTQDPRAELASDFALTIGRVWGGVHGAFWGLVIGLAISALIWAKGRGFLGGR